MLGVILQIGAVLVSLLVIHYVVKLVRYYRYFVKMPGPPYDLLFRHKVSELATEYHTILDFRHEWHTKFPRLCRFFIGPYGYISIAHPESVRKLVSRKYPKNLYYSLMLYPWTGDGLLVSYGKKWFRTRKMLNPSFSHDIVGAFMSVFSETASVMFGLWDEASQRDGYIVLQDHVSYLALDNLLQCIGSVKTNCQVEKQNLPYVRDVNDLTRLTWLRYTCFRNMFDIYFYNTNDGKQYKNACERSKNLALDLILERRKELQNVNSSSFVAKKDFLHILLTTTDENGKGLTDEEICDEVNTVIFAGHDTTAISMEWVLYFLAKFPNYQEMCRNEVLNCLKEDDIKASDLAGLEFLTMCIKESMRIKPSVHTIGRETEGPDSFEGFKLPTGTMIQISILNLHWNPDIWPQPFKFDPYRFSAENIDKIHPYSYLPFGYGERNCMGQNFAMHEIKTVIGMVLKRYKLVLHPTLVNKDIEIKKDLLFKPLTPIKLILEQY